MLKRKALFNISLMIMVSSLLFIIGNNIPVLVSFRWFWGPIFILFSILFYTEVFRYKNVYSVIIYGILFVGILQYSVWIYAFDAYKSAIFNDFYALIVFVVLFTILLYNSYYNEWVKLAKIGLWFFIITCFMTIIATRINPLVVRASYSSLKLEMVDFYAIYKLGFGTYGFMTSLVALFPILVFFIKNNKGWLSRKKAIVLIILFYFVLIQAQIFSNILVASATLVLAFLGSQKFIRNIIVIIILGIIIKKIPESFWVNTLFSLSDSFEKGSSLSNKFQDIAKFFNHDNPLFSEDATTGVGVRAARYPMLGEAFLDSPFFGDASYHSKHEIAMSWGKHLYWMSRLALWGIFGFLGYIIILKNAFKPVLKLFANNFIFYYTLSLLSIIALGLLKNLALRETYIILFIIIPGLYFTQFNPIHVGNLKKQ
jgi:hypothetical protein